MSAAADAAVAPVWLLTGDRPGEVAQQRTIGAAIGVPVRELQLARLQATGGRAQIDLSGLRPPWPRLAMSFGKTLPAALALRAASGGTVRIVHLGRARGVKLAELDLVIPMPQDRVPAADNVLTIRMPFNRLTVEAPGAIDDRLARAGLSHPITTLVIGGTSRQVRFTDAELLRMVATVSARVRARGGSLLISSSPRTPARLLPALRAAMDADGEFYAFERHDPHNPFAAYLRLADELIVSGDSASMVGECWRTAKPLLVVPAQRNPRHRLRAALRRTLPEAWIASGHLKAEVDINRWLELLAGEGHIGMLGRSEPWRRYCAADDDDLPRVVERIRGLLSRP